MVIESARESVANQYAFSGHMIYYEGPRSLVILQRHESWISKSNTQLD